MKESMNTITGTSQCSDLNVFFLRLFLRNCKYCEERGVKDPFDSGGPTVVASTWRA